MKKCPGCAQYIHFDSHVGVERCWNCGLVTDFSDLTTPKQKRFLQVLRLAFSLFLTAFASFWLFVYLFLIYDEMHIKSTDNQLQDNLTHAQVAFDIVKTSLLAAGLTIIVAYSVYWLNRVQGVPRSGKPVAAVCWCFMLVIIIVLGIHHYADTAARI